MTPATAFNTEILDLWRIHSQPRIPTLYPEDYFNGNIKLVVMGMNPSFSKTFPDFVKDLNIPDGLGGVSTADHVFRWRDPLTEQQIKDVLLVESFAFTKYKRYFEPIEKFAKAVKCYPSFRHIDLFHVRVTNQKELLSLVRAHPKNPPVELNPFGQSQVEITLRTLARINPPVVVITNAAASRIATASFKLSALENSRTCFKMQGLPNTVFFLSSMLSGGAMDSYSKARLEDEVLRFVNGTD